MNTSDPRGAPAIVTLTRMAFEEGCPVLQARTLVIQADVPFDIVGNSWVFGREAAKQFRAVLAEHRRKIKALGLKERPRQFRGHPSPA